MVTRRTFVARRAAACHGGAPSRPKIAAICTTYFKYSHAQHIVDRFLKATAGTARTISPPMDLVSLYVDQVGQERSEPRSRRASSRR